MRLRLHSCVLGLALVSSASACGARPTESQCEAFVDHFVELLQSEGYSESGARKLRDKQHERLMKTCVLEGTAAEVECSLEQSSLADIEANCKS